MTEKPVSLSFNGTMKKVWILYTFSFNKKRYAFVSLDADYKEPRVLKIKYSITNGNSAELVTDEDDVLRAGEAVYNEISTSQKTFFNGENYKVVKDETDNFNVSIAGKLSRFSPVFRFASAAVALLFSFEIAGAELYWYFKHPHDWIAFMFSQKSQFLLGIGTFAFVILMVIGTAVYQRIKGKGSGTGFGIALFAPPLIVLSFGFVARSGVRIFAVLILSLITALFIYKLFEIKRMNNNREKKDSLDKLLRYSKPAVVCALIVITAFSAVLGYISPYRRNESVGFIKKTVIEKQHSVACQKIENNAWHDINNHDKLKFLQSIIDYNAMENGSFSAKLVPASLNSWLDTGKTYGTFIDEYNLIYIDEDYALNNTATDSIETVLHEYRHCWQSYITENNSASDEDDEKLSTAIKENYNNYGSAYLSGYSKYHSQLVEVDSRYYVSNLLNTYLEYVSPEDYESSDYYNRCEREDYILKSFKSDDDWSYAVCHSYDKGDDNSQDYIELVNYLGKGNVKSVTIPSETEGLPVKSLARDLFKYSTHLEKVVIPRTVNSISDFAFDKCAELTVEIDPGNTNYEMIDSTMLVSLRDNKLLWVDKKSAGTITIPQNIESIGWYALSGCNISNVDVQNGNKQYFSKDGLLYNRKTNAFVLCPEGREGVVELSEGCTVIRSESFGNCVLVTDVIIPDSVKEIESEAFTGCSSLLRLTIPSTVKKVSAFAFRGLSNIDRLTISKNASFCKNDDETDNYLVLTNASLKDLYFDGTKAEWENVNAVFTGYLEDWFGAKRSVVIHCSDGIINITA